MKIALATFNQIFELNEDDKIFAKNLTQNDLEFEVVDWENENISWQRFDLVLIRTCWNYFKKPQKFLLWLESLHKQNIKIQNSFEVVKWNINKTYLKFFATKGFKITPTIWFESKKDFQIFTVLRETGWKKLVVKPMISGGAFETYVVTKENALELKPKLEESAKRSGVLVQKFLPEIQTKGEWSLIFFGNEFSHAILKKAKDGDFRVQSEFGGSVNVETPPKNLVETAQKMVDSLEKDLLYVRVDGVEIANEFVLMEFEALEPELFFRTSENSAQFFTNKIKDFLAEK